MASGGGKENYRDVKTKSASEYVRICTDTCTFNGRLITCWKQIAFTRYRGKGKVSGLPLTLAYAVPCSSPSFPLVAPARKREVIMESVP